MKKARMGFSLVFSIETQRRATHACFLHDRVGKCRRTFRRSSSEPGCACGRPPAFESHNQASLVDYRCWRRNGVRHCRDDNWIPRYGAGSPDDYRIGTAEWYRAMQREDRLEKGRR